MRDRMYPISVVDGTWLVSRCATKGEAEVIMVEGVMVVLSLEGKVDANVVSTALVLSYLPDL